MNKTTAFTLILGVTVVWPLRAADEPKTFKDDNEKIGYAIGQDIGKNLRGSGIRTNEFDMGGFDRGVRDAIDGKPGLTDPELKEIFQALSAKLLNRHVEDNKDFLTANKTKEGVMTLPDGLQYKIISEGTGPNPTAMDTVIVHYNGTLIDGRVFDRSPTNNPVTIGLGNVIPGWKEAIPMMKTGAKWQLFIPSELAYGERPPSRSIPPNSTLIFDVELVGIQPPPSAAAGTPPPVPALTSDIIKVPSLEEMKKGAQIETIKQEDLEKLQKEQQLKQANPEKKP